LHLSNPIDLPKKLKRCRKESKKSTHKTREALALDLVDGWADLTLQQKKNKNIKQEIEALKHELQLKIQENEQVHISMFERKSEFNKQIDQYKEDIAEMEKNRQIREIEFQNLSQSKEQIEKEINSIKEEKRQLSMQYAQNFYF
jgi:uncharacterized coiled-coil DUF342 family protein